LVSCLLKRTLLVASFLETISTASPISAIYFSSAAMTDADPHGLPRHTFLRIE